MSSSETQAPDTVCIPGFHLWGLVHQWHCLFKRNRYVAFHVKINNRDAQQDSPKNKQYPTLHLALA